MNNIKLICFDLDETLISHSSWKELGLALGISYEEDERFYKEYKSGLITYDEWNNKILNLYLKHKDANKEEITKILSRYSYNKGAREIIGYLKNKGYILVLISGSIDILVNMVAKDLDINLSKANNTFIFDDQDRIREIISGGDDTLSKMSYLSDFCKKLNLELKDCACIGDGANDIEMFRQTKQGITFKGSTIENEAWKVVESLEDIKNIF